MPPRAVTDQGVQLQPPLEPAEHNLNRPPIGPQLRDPLRRLRQEAGDDRPPLPLRIPRINYPPLLPRARLVRSQVHDSVNGSYSPAPSLAWRRPALPRSPL